MKCDNCGREVDGRDFASHYRVCSAGGTELRRSAKKGGASVGWEGELAERLFQAMQTGRFAVAPLPLEWRLAKLAGKNGLVRWRKGDAAIEMSYYSDMRAESVLREVSTTFQVKFEPELHPLKHYPTLAAGLAGSSGPILHKYVVVPSATAQDVITFTYMETIGLTPLSHVDALRAASESTGLKVFDELVQSLHLLSSDEFERAREAIREQLDKD